MRCTQTHTQTQAHRNTQTELGAALNAMASPVLNLATFVQVGNAWFFKRITSEVKLAKEFNARELSRTVWWGGDFGDCRLVGILAETAYNNNSNNSNNWKCCQRHKRQNIHIALLLVARINKQSRQQKCLITHCGKREQTVYVCVSRERKRAECSRLSAAVAIQKGVWECTTAAAAGFHSKLFPSFDVDLYRWNDCKSESGNQRREG